MDALNGIAPYACTGIIINILVTHRAYGPYALCVTLFNDFRCLILEAYCVVIEGIPTHEEGIPGGSRN